jgi:cell division protein FtsW (lipid II flippase)
MFLVFLTLLYVFGRDLRTFFLNSVLIIPGIIASYVLFYHIRVRVEAWINPWTDITDKGYQISQSLFAIATGGFFGTGIGMGRPDMVPAVTTDFIFSAICEELGIFGGVAVVLLFMLFTYRGIKIILGVKNRFNKILGFGIVVMFGLQTFIIIGGVIKLIPLAGITLPFVSYGGSSLTTSFIALGIMQAISNPDIDEAGGEAYG